jgi:hypothetical protein
MTGANTFGLLEGAPAFGIHLMLTDSAMVWAMTYFDFVHLPVDFRVVFTKPGQPKDDILLAEAGDHECHMFRVILVFKDGLPHFRNTACFIRGAIHIINRDGAA